MHSSRQQTAPYYPITDLMLRGEAFECLTALRPVRGFVPLEYENATGIILIVADRQDGSVAVQSDEFPHRISGVFAFDVDAELLPMGVLRIHRTVQCEDLRVAYVDLFTTTIRWTYGRANRDDVALVAQRD